MSETQAKYLWQDEAHGRIATLEAALDKAKQRELNALYWMQERDNWAKAWKRAAMVNRKRWILKKRCLGDNKQFREKANRILDLLGQPRITPE